jgi:hypothetical protein
LVPLAIGSVLGRAFGVMTGNPVTVFSIAFLFGALPQVVFTLSTQIETGGNPAAEAGLAALYVGYLIVFVLCSALAQAALVRATSAYLDGRAAGLAECVRVGIRKALPIIGFSILFGIALVFGLLLLVVPGIILFVRWAVAAPALVEEDCSVREAFGRSSELTHGARWQVLFLMIVVFVIIWLISAIAAIPALMAGIAQSDPTPTVASIILALVTSTITTALWATIITSLYFSLRDRRDGPQSQRLEDVFA